MNKRFGKNDMIFLGIILVLGIGLFVIFQMQDRPIGEKIVIEQDGKTYGTYSLLENQSISIMDDEGNITNMVVVEEGVAYVEQATCPDHLCMEQKSISRDKETIVCLPNKVTVTVMGGEKNDLDAVAN